MAPADLDPDMTYAEMVRVYRQYSEPFASLNQVDVFLKIAGWLRQTTPAETEGAGERIQTHDIESAIVEARRQRGVLTLGSQTATVIVPPDDLR